LAECFNALWYSAYFSESPGLWQKKRGPLFELAWISYAGPRIANLIHPPQNIVVERQPDGGLLMAATTGPFNVANPTHLAAARDIADAVAALRDRPWPPDPPFH